MPARASGCPAFRSGVFDRLPDAGIAGTAAQIAGHGAIDPAVVRCRFCLQQRDRAHDLTGLAVTALGDIEIVPGLAHSLPDFILRHRFYGDDRLPFRPADGGDAGSDGLAIEMDRAGPAQAGTAAKNAPDYTGVDAP